MLNVQVFKADQNNSHFSLIEKWVNSFTEEISLYAERSMEEPWLLYSESSMLGFFANGIIRSDSKKVTTILQEFRVNNSGAYHGRSDMLIFHHNNAFLVEGKFAKGDGSDVNFKNNLVQVALHQVEGYYNSEASAYSVYSSATLIALLFYVIQLKDKEAFHKYCEQAKSKSLVLDNEFYSLITPKEIALSSYENYAAIEVCGVLKETSKMLIES